MPPPLQKPEDKLDRIITILEKMNRRDRLRTIGGFFRTIISFIPIALVIFFTWYGIKYSDELLQKITSKAAEQAGRVARESAVGNFFR